MIFSIQRFLEDYFARRNLRDVDQYAVSFSNLYDRERQGKSASAFLKTARRIRTLFYRNNLQLNRSEFEKSILTVLDGQLKKKPRRELDSSQGASLKSVANSESGTG